MLSTWPQQNLSEERFRVMNEVQGVRLRSQILQCVEKSNLPLQRVARRLNKTQGHVHDRLYGEVPLSLEEATKIAFLCGYRLEVELVPLAGEVQA